MPLDDTSSSGDIREFLFKQIKLVQNLGSQKRNEENMKFIFKFVMKKIQDQLCLPSLHFY